MTLSVLQKNIAAVFDKWRLSGLLQPIKWNHCYYFHKKTNFENSVTPN